MFRASHEVYLILRLLSQYGYLILFPMVIVEGPIVTIIAGFLASIGVLNPVIAYAVVVAGDLGGDVLYYFAGRYWFNKTFEKTLAFFKVSLARVKKLEENLHKHRGKVLFFGKLSHLIGVAILFVAGHAAVPFDDFLWFNFLATLPKSAILLAVGYFFGTSVSNFGRYVGITSIGLFLFTLILIALYFSITFISGKLFKILSKSE